MFKINVDEGDRRNVSIKRKGRKERDFFMKRKGIRSVKMQNWVLAIPFPQQRTILSFDSKKQVLVARIGQLLQLLLTPITQSNYPHPHQTQHVPKVIPSQKNLPFHTPYPYPVKFKFHSILYINSTFSPPFPWSNLPPFWSHYPLFPLYNHNHHYLGLQRRPGKTDPYSITL